MSAPCLGPSVPSCRPEPPQGAHLSGRQPHSGYFVKMVLIIFSIKHLSVQRVVSFAVGGQVAVGVGGEVGAGGTGEGRQRDVSVLARTTAALSPPCSYPPLTEGTPGKPDARQSPSPRLPAAPHPRSRPPTLGATFTPRGHLSAPTPYRPGPPPEKDARPRILMSLYCSFGFDYRKKKKGVGGGGKEPVYKSDVIQRGPAAPLGAASCALGAAAAAAGPTAALGGCCRSWGAPAGWGGPGQPREGGGGGHLGRSSQLRLRHSGCEVGDSRCWRPPRGPHVQRRGGGLGWVVGGGEASH